MNFTFSIFIYILYVGICSIVSYRVTRVITSRFCHEFHNRRALVFVSLEQLMKNHFSVIQFLINKSRKREKKVSVSSHTRISTFGLVETNSRYESLLLQNLVKFVY